jgi:hypothetical protein
MAEGKQFTASEARDIGEKLGIDWQVVDLEQLRMGLGVEMEHSDSNPTTDVTHGDPITTGKIAWAHLNEFPDYYTRLADMEREAKKYWAGRSE